MVSLSTVAQFIAVIEQRTWHSVFFVVDSNLGKVSFTLRSYPNKWSRVLILLEKFTCKTLLASHETFKRIFFFFSSAPFSFPAHKSYIREGCWPNRTTFSIIYVCRTLPSITQVWPTGGINQTRRSFFVVTRLRVKPLLGYLFGLGGVDAAKMSMRNFENFESMFLLINYSSGLQGRISTPSEAHLNLFLGW